MAVRDYCLVWGCPGLIILTISLFVSLKVGNDFGQDNFAKLVTFVISSGLLGTVYYLFQSVLTEVPLRLQNRQRQVPMLLTDQETEAVTEDSTDNMSFEQVHECLAEVLPQTESAQEHLSEELQEPTIEISDSAEPTKEVSDTIETSSEQTDLYTQRCKEYQREQEQRRHNTIDAIMEYVTHIMSPYIYDNDELEKLLDAIRKWADDWQHKPVPIRLKSTLTTLDLRHFVWNIAERLGSKKDYTGEVRAIFIKRMFPDVMRDIELDSIRNFKFQPDMGNIVIDEPDKGDYHFHFE
ncbi:MAG: hypothetical protein SOZ87_04610 [Candidatus Cryptobacteroides sp.]|nr:hypothetical protein [Prevotella sp.]MDY3834322.1 hypothetical protein [Candidatus Cryptobacteroides sp.]